MTLPPPAERKLVHTRQVAFRGYHRADRFWDIEAEVTDTKSYLFTSAGLGPVPPGTPIHAMAIRATVDDDLTIREIAAAMHSRPHDECMEGMAPLQKLVGCTLGPGWRATLEKHLGGSLGCTHLRELLFNMATAAFQSIPIYRQELARAAGQPEGTAHARPFHLGKCIAWDTAGALTLKHFPLYFVPPRRTGDAAGD
ncbi:MAG TPA: DUF2889 domain-containing protein [Ramlibacter sp.]|nr:DUF2889 domain-containing protein [Ramlibacter sp.]